METCRSLPAPNVCQIEKFVSSADYWTCLVEDPEPCQYVVTIGTAQICSLASKSGALLKMKIEGKKIVVRYADSSLGLVSRALLDKLIEFRRISAFERSSGWVDIVNGPIRGETSIWRFNGLQRRAGAGNVADHHFQRRP